MDEKEYIRGAALRAVGNGMKGAAFELGAEWALTTFPKINDLAKQAYETDLRRGKVEKDLPHLDTFFGIFSELKEFREASEIDKSDHLPEYTQAQEELADVLICCLTELHRRGVDVERIIKDKIEFNKTKEERIAELETMIRNGYECLSLRRRPGMSPMLKEANESFEQMIKELEKELELLKGGAE